MVFVTIEAAQSGAPGALGDVPGPHALDHFGEGLDQRFTFGISRLDIFVIGWHFLVLDLVDDIFEELEVFEGVVDRVDFVKSDSAFLFVGSVAGNAVLLEDRMGLIGKAIGKSGSNAAEKNKNGSE